MKHVSLIGICSALLFLGAGCSNTPDAAVVDTIEYAPPTTLVGPADPKTEQAYSFCEKNGYKLLVQFDQIEQKPRAYCVFSNNSQCELFRYFDGTCGPEQGATLYTDSSADISALLRGCSETDPVVCGKNGLNYTNRCAALIQKVDIAHDGACTAKEQEAAIAATSASTESEISQAQPSDVEITKEDAASPVTELPEKPAIATWVPMLQQIIKSASKSTPAATIDSCMIDDDVYYLLSAPLAVLYDADGGVACFPKNDMTGACPEEFNPQAQCTRIWTDKR